MRNKHHLPHGTDTMKGIRNIRPYTMQYIGTFIILPVSFFFCILSTPLFAADKIPPLSLKPLDLSRTPTNRELMSAGQLGGQLFPTADMAATEVSLSKAQQAAGQVAVQKQLAKNQAAVNLSFGKAIQAWNKHEYKDAVRQFVEHLQKYPDSPWTAESALHIGCDARYSGRYTEATEQFNWIINEFSNNSNAGAKRLVTKAKLRLANIKVLQNNFPEAKKYFRALIQEGDDWRSRTYRSHWLQRLSRLGKDKLALLNCGMQALAVLLKNDGRPSTRIFSVFVKQRICYNLRLIMRQCSGLADPNK